MGTFLKAISKMGRHLERELIPIFLEQLILANISAIKSMEKVSKIQTNLISLGCYIWPSGDKYEGEFIHGSITGKGSKARFTFHIKNFSDF